VGQGLEVKLHVNFAQAEIPCAHKFLHFFQGSKTALHYPAYFAYGPIPFFIFFGQRLIPVTQSAYAKIESGKAQPRMATCKRLAAAMNVEWEQLME